MFLITNREVDEKSSTPAALGSKLNSKGPNELRVAEANKIDGKWRIRILPDACTKEMLAAVNLKPETDAQGAPKPSPASRYVAYKVLLELRARHKQRGKPPALAFFVHGFNNDVKAVLDRAQAFQDLYGVEVIPFTWPANGGGAIGTLSYKSDKRDALASAGALDRAIAKVHEYVQKMNEVIVAKSEAEAEANHTANAEMWDDSFTRSMTRDCPFTLNLILHSMGNYVFKSFMGSSSYRGNLLVFDNVVMAAADTNNDSHAEWVDRIQCRRRVYITINENDGALRASRLKAGEEQKARLGHWVHHLDSSRAVYVDFTGAPHVGDSHAYFEGGPVEKNEKVRKFFDLALNGEIAEADLRFDPSRNLHRLR